MELTNVEMNLGICFPKLFHAISQSGMMDYLIYSREWVADKRKNDRDYTWKEDFFGKFMGDCRMIAFEDLQSSYDDLYECLDDIVTIYPECQSINPKYKLIPFARRISSDKYCFLYEDGKEEPKVVLYGHDTGDFEWWANDFEEFIFFQIVEEIANDDRETIDSDYIKAHIKWLNDNHKQLLAEVPISKLWEELPEPEDFNIWVGIT